MNGEILWNRFKGYIRTYPRVFWLLYFGGLVNATGVSITWPLLSRYATKTFGISTTEAMLLLTLQALMGVLSGSVAGWATDRFGRKSAMVLGLIAGGVNLILMSMAGSIGMWAVLMALRGFFSPLYDVGSNAMISDMIEPEQRKDAYALLRMGHNVGVATGPMIGTFVIAISYSLAFYVGAIASLFFGALILLYIPETLAKGSAESSARTAPASLAEWFAGWRTRLDQTYGQLWRDKFFLAFWLAYGVSQMPYMIMFALLPLYAMENFNVPDERVSLIMSVNAIMVVTLQYAISHFSNRYRDLSVIAAGVLLYALGVGSVTFGEGLAAFMASMVVLTLGEMMTRPVATTVVADLAPANMRGRYMGVFGMAFYFAYGIGPVIGGWLSDNVSVRAPWIGAFVLGIVGFAGFLALRLVREPSAEQTERAATAE